MIRTSCVTRKTNFNVLLNLNVVSYSSNIKPKPKFRPKVTLPSMKLANNDRTMCKSLKDSTRITNKHHSTKVKGEILYGVYPILMALKSGNRKFFQIYYNENSMRTRQIVEIANTQRISTELVNGKFLNELAKNSTKEYNVHQGVCADVEKVPISNIQLNILNYINRER